MKRKVLACVLACAMLFLGMGYAYWTDSLQVDTKVSTGELDVRFVDLALFGQYDDELGWAIFDGIDPELADKYFDRGTEGENKPLYNIIADPDALEAYKARIQGYTTTGFDAKLVDKKNLGKDVGDYVRTTKSSDKIEISIKDIYPGYAQLFRSDIVNPGTLAAKLSQIKATFAGDNNAVKNMIGISLKVMREDGRQVFNLLPNDNFFEIGGEKFVRLSALDDYTVDGDNLLSIYPVNKDMDGDQWRMDLILGVAMDPDPDGVYTTGSVANYKNNDDTRTQLKNASFTLKFGWDQFNTPVAESEEPAV